MTAPHTSLESSRHLDASSPWQWASCRSQAASSRITVIAEVVDAVGDKLASLKMQVTTPWPPKAPHADERSGMGSKHSPLESANKLL
jgi:hypothetical protein